MSSNAFTLPEKKKKAKTPKQKKINIKTHSTTEATLAYQSLKDVL